MLTKKSAVSLCLCGALLMSGYNMMPAHEGLIKPTISVNALSDIDKNIINTVKKYLPKGAQLVNPTEPKGSESIQLKDIDGDGKDEIIAAYKTTTESSSLGPNGLLVLKETDAGWKKLLDYRSEGHSTELLEFRSITGADKNDIVIAWGIGASAGNKVDIFSWKNNRLTKIDSFYANKLEIQDMPDINGKTDGRDELAIWQHDTGEAYKIQVLRWNANEFVPATDVYPYYFKKVVPYYEQKTKEMPGAAFYWYYLADAQLKAGYNKKAITSADKGIEILKKFPEYYPNIQKFERLKKEAQDKVERNE